MRDARQKKLCIVLDNPGRDLLGIGLLSALLASRGIDVVIVPMYDQQQHVVHERPDMVLVNYARKANRKALCRYKKLGIRVGVLDTEGGVLRCEYQELLNIVLNSGAKDLIDDYFLWGNRQYQAFRKCHDISKTMNLYLTGCPRFDLYSGSWSWLIPAPPSNDSAYVLIATSFPLNNPRFASPDREIDNVIETMGQERPVLERARVAADRALQGMLRLIRVTCARYPEQIFVLRPHPFESDTIYRDALSDVTNLRIARGGTLSSWLKRAEAVIQLNSSVAFEAGLLGKPVISLEMFQDPTLEVTIASACSLQAHNEAEYWELLDHLIRRAQTDRIIRESADVKKALDLTIVEWIYKHDGQSSLRVAEALDKILQSLPTRPHSGLGWLYQYVALHLYFVAKLGLKRLLNPRAWKNARFKRFSASDFRPLSAFFAEYGLDAMDRALGGIWPFSRSNAVKVTSARDSAKL